MGGGGNLYMYLRNNIIFIRTTHLESADEYFRDTTSGRGHEFCIHKAGWVGAVPGVAAAKR